MSINAKKIAWVLMFISFAVQGLMIFAIELLLMYLMIGKWKRVISSGGICIISVHSINVDSASVGIRA